MSEANARTCIYCKRTEPACGFNREHVLPQAFGRFEDNLVLHDAVCADCNDHFGRTFDLFLGRDSWEALLRFRHGLKDPHEVRGMFDRRIHVTLPRDGTQWGGVHLELVPPIDERHEPVVDLVPQVGFERLDGDGWDYWTEDDVRNATSDFKSLHDERYGKHRVILYDCDESRDRLLALLEELEIPFKREDEFRGFPPFESGEVRAEIDAHIDRDIVRAMAKIGFNYMAYACGAEFALRSEFDAIRAFIRESEGPADWRAFVEIRQEPILADDSPRWRQTDGHIVALNWNRARTRIMVRVSPFNGWTYLIKLARRFHGIFREIGSGHVFDINTRRVISLTHTSRIIPVHGLSGLIRSIRNLSPW